jgi:hypothetical protein
MALLLALPGGIAGEAKIARSSDHPREIFSARFSEYTD